MALAVILSGVRHISDTVFLEAAKVEKNNFKLADPVLYFAPSPSLCLSFPVPAASVWCVYAHLDLP